MLRGKRAAALIVAAAVMVAGAWSVSPVSAQSDEGPDTTDTTIPPDDTTPNDPNGDGTSGETVPNDPNGDGTSGQTIPNDPNGGQTTSSVPNDPNGTGTTSTSGAGDSGETGASTTSSPPGTPLIRVSGDDRAATAIAVSRSSFPEAGSAQAVVLASATRFPDALAGTPLAVLRGGPVLLTGGSLDQAVRDELARVLPVGGSVIIVGGPVAVPETVAAALREAGFMVTRIAGADRFATSVQVVDAMGDPATLLVATGLDFPDALSAGAVGASSGAGVLLSSGPALAPVVQAYIERHPSATRFAIGGAATRADTGATAVSGADRYETSRRVAEQFFAQAQVVGLATGTAFPDALAGGAHAGRLHGPLLLTDPAQLLPTTREYLTSVKGARGYVYGGPAAVTETVSAEAASALS